MTFEEFFKKKKIDLALLEKAEPALFAEFEVHYAVMGEKSFDHTKKYWFNELRRKYHTPEEVKQERVTIENQLAEQTLLDAVSNDIPEETKTKLGFKPKFSTGVSAASDKTDLPVEETTSEAPTEAAVPKLGFKPKFSAGINKATTSTASAEVTKPAEQAAVAAPKPGFTPKFKAGITKPAVSGPAPVEELKTNEPVAGAITAPKLGFKPKFKAKSNKPTTEEE